METLAGVPGCKLNCQAQVTGPTGQPVSMSYQKIEIAFLK